MPYKDPAMKLKQMKRWRQRSIENGYGKWLYARRRVRFEDAKHFRIALERIAYGREEDAAGIAERALRDSLTRHNEIGPPPKGAPE